MNQDKIKKTPGLIAAIAIDLIGYATYSVPLLGEFGDVVWAPVSAYLIYKLFRSKSAAAVGFIEEALPWTDFIPTATITWALLYFGILKTEEDNLEMIITQEDTDRNSQ